MQGVKIVSSWGTWISPNKKKFILSRDVIFVEPSKTDNVFEWKLDHLDKFSHAKIFREFDNEIPHIEEGIPILDQYEEFPSE